MPSLIEVGDTLEYEGVAYTVLRIVPLNEISRLFPDRDRWGTHVLLLARVIDGRRCVANRFESGALSQPEDWLEDYM